MAVKPSHDGNSIKVLVMAGGCTGNRPGDGRAARQDSRMPSRWPTGQRRGPGNIQESVMTAIPRRPDFGSRQ